MSDFLTDPQAITQASFAIIQEELTARGLHFPPGQAQVIERIIHSTGDFDFATLTRFSPGAVERSVARLRQGCPVVTDVNMVRVGISQARLTGLGGELHCFVAHPEVHRRAREEGTTRSALGIRLAWERGLVDGGVLAIGNAPTALYELLRLVDEEGARPALVIGVPVGFVSTAESKAALMAQETVPWIATEGRKGGSPVAVAAVNALLRLAQEAS